MMPTAESERNKATLRRLIDAIAIASPRYIIDRITENSGGGGLRRV
jgi:hypothetical protein